jgi:alpha-D-ribose 1-methylphosphonate 5-triphosphate synthase subunit PhnL
MAAWAEKPEDTAGLKKVKEVLAIMKRLDVGLDLWQSQNIYFSTGKAIRGQVSREWVRAFKSVGQFLRVDPAVFLPSEPV